MSFLPNDSPKGCILQAKLEYFKELQDLHIDDPLAAEKIEIYEKKHCLIIAKNFTDIYDVSVGTVKKIVPNLYEKEMPCMANICSSVWN